MGQTLTGLIAAISLIGLTVSACSQASSVFDHLPEAAGGMPSGAPARPAQPYRYPAVHDMPPPRGDKTLSEEDQLKLEKDLAATRDRQAADALKEDEPPPAPPPPKAKPSKTGAATGRKPNP